MALVFKHPGCRPLGIELWKTAETADGIDAIPAAEDAALLTVLSHPEFPVLILLTTERVTGGGGGAAKDC